MIKSITIRDVASYDHEGVTFSDLKKVNFVFGGNGTGKTTLGRAINSYNPADGYVDHCTMEWDGEPVEVLAYNSDFKERNLQESIPGVFTIGEDQKKINSDLDHWRERRNECLKAERAAYKAMADAKSIIKAEQQRLQDLLWQKYYLPYKDLEGCLKGYTGKVSFAERIKHYVSRQVVSFLYLEDIAAIRKLYQQIFIDDSIGPDNPMAEKVKLERENLTNEFWRFLAQMAEDEVNDHEKTMADLRKHFAKSKEFHESAMLTLSRVDQSIKSTESMISSLQPSIESINNTLSSYGFTGFSIQPSPKAHRQYQIQRADGSFVETSLSEGEQTFITFLYFMQLAQGMTDNEDIDTRRVLVVDDPISSLDSEVMYVVYTRLNDLINEVLEGKSNIQQVFVLTHNTEFHRLLSQRKRTSDVHYYKLVKRNGVSRLLAYGETNSVKTEYEMQWQELRQLNEGHSVPNAQNAMRKILETYFVRLGGYDKRTIIFDIFPDNTEEQIIAKSLLKWMDEGSHGSISALYAGDPDAINYRYLEVFHQIFTRLGHEAHYMMMIKNR